MCILLSMILSSGKNNKNKNDYDLEDWQKDLVNKKEYDKCNFEEDDSNDEDDYYYEDDK